MNALGFGWNGRDVTPGILNEWLHANDGYAPGTSDLDEGAISNFAPDLAPGWRLLWPDDGMHTSPDLSPEDVNTMLEAGRVVIANVMEGHHFVLALGASDDAIFVRDSGFDRELYNFTDAVGWRVFDVVPAE